jgi:hypothetical protein
MSMLRAERPRLSLTTKRSGVPWVAGAVAGLVGAGDAAFAAWDQRAQRTSPSMLEHTTTWYDLTLIALGGVGAMAGWAPDLCDPLLLGGTALLARQSVFFASGKPDFSVAATRS